jgi:protein-L-isoaspartate O-methyltransferase
MMAMNLTEENIKLLFRLQRSTDFFENVILATYRAVLRPGDTAVDGGAHRGFHTYPMAECVGPSGKIHAFEVLPALVEAMQKRIETEPLSQVRVHRQALSDRYVSVGEECSGL